MTLICLHRPFLNFAPVGQKGGYDMQKDYIIITNNPLVPKKLGEEYKTHCDNHALPENFETMDYMEFLSKRRTLMAQIIKKAFERL